MKNYSKILLIVSFIFFAFFAQAQHGVFDVTAYGAKGDDQTINTTAFQQAIDACSRSGGGEVVVPSGIYRIGTVHLKSNIHLIVKAGAVVKGSSRLSDYETHIPGKPFLPIHKGMFFTENADAVTISGEGTIDGNGDIFFDTLYAKKIDSASLAYARQGLNYRKVVSGIGDGPVVPKDRPYQMFVFSQCTRVTVRDIKISNAPFWCLHFADCDAIQATGLRLWNSLLVPNADGIDVTSCTNVLISNCDIRAGDDAIAITGYNHHFEIPGYKWLYHLSENIIVSNCTLQSASSAIRIGWQDQNTVRNVSVNNVVITNSTRGIGIFLRDEGSLENLNFSNIRIQTRLRTGDWWGNGEPIHISAIYGINDVGLGHIRNVSFTNISCTGENGILVYGSDESRIEGLSFKGIHFELADSPLNESAGGNIDLRGTGQLKFGLFSRDIPGILLRKVDDVSVDDVTLGWTGTRMPYFTHGLEAEDVKGLRVAGFRGNASPINKKAWRIYVHESSDFHTDDEGGVMRAAMKN